MGYHGRFPSAPIVTAAVVHRKAFVYVSGYLMTWVRLDDQFFLNPKVLELSKDAKLLYLAALAQSSSSLTDGHISYAMLRVVAATVDVDIEISTQLIETELWVDCGQYFLINDYLEYNPSAETIKERRRSNAERQKRHRNNTAEVSNADSNAVTNTVTTKTVTPLVCDSPSPSPSPSQLTTKTPKSKKKIAPNKLARDIMFESIAECWIGKPYQDITLTKSQRGVLNTAVKQLKQIKIDPSEIPREWAILRERYDNPSPSALVKHWGTNGTGPRKQQPSTVGEFNRNESDELWNEFYRELEADTGRVDEHGHHLRDPTKRRGSKGLAEGH